ncbi:MAG: PBP1A family penicillin-binding protein [Deltaproteobacteria bacterium]|nr:PBP1A family penicillin-binding protein [Deltaproteobacteria bacterium]
MSPFRILLAAVVVLGLALGAAGTAFYVGFVRDLPSFETLADYRPPLTSNVFDRQGRPIGEFYEHRRQLTPLEDVPRLVIRAFLAAEDDTFYEHAGVDYLSILRAAWANLRAGGEKVQGASTITQQTVKQLLLSSEQTYKRKIRELILARRIEQRFSKDEILYLYLNQIYFGAGAYGIGEAARTYFGKTIGEIDASEAAMLAGLPKAPGRNSPYLNPERAEERRVYVLDRMQEEGFLGAEAHATAVESPPLLRDREAEANSAASYVTEEVRRSLVAILGNDAVLHGGLRIETSIDLDLQTAAVAAVRGGLEALDRRRGYRGPLRRVEDLEADGPTDALEELARLNAFEEQPEPHGRPLVALVLDVEKERARIALAPGIDAELRLEDLGWARREEERRREVKDLTKVFSAGDIVPVMLASDEVEEGALPRARLAQHPEAQGALLSFEIETGDILAMVGGYDFKDSEFNRTTQASRQPGSAFKPIVYAAALGRGYTPASVLYDRPVVIESEGFTWRPENYGRKFLGPILLGEALARSVNNATIHLLQDVGIDHVMEFSRQLGIEGPLERNLGLALGSNPVTLLEITRAYGIFAAGGRRVEPRLILRVLDRDGQVLLEALPLAAPMEEPTEETLETAELPEPAEEGELPEGYAMPPQQAYLASSVLRLVVDHPRGTGRRARSLGRPVAGKTGTTNDQGDAWFVGFSPDVATGVWVGFDEKRVLGRGETGGRAALPIWIEFMGAALAGRPVRDFAVPEGIVFARIDSKSGLLATSASDQTLFQAFAEGTEPTEQADRAVTRTGFTIDLLKEGFALFQ